MGLSQPVSQNFPKTQCRAFDLVKYWRRLLQYSRGQNASAFWIANMRLRIAYRHLQASRFLIALRQYRFADLAPVGVMGARVCMLSLTQSAGSFESPGKRVRSHSQAPTQLPIGTGNLFSSNLHIPVIGYASWSTRVRLPTLARIFIFATRLT
jgi:hypothetical protein